MRLGKRITGIEKQGQIAGQSAVLFGDCAIIFRTGDRSAFGPRPDSPRRLRATPWYRVVIEKPFGRDLASARALDADIHRFLQEDQIYRIDHYLGKETVLNLMAFRFANAIFEPLLNCEFVDHVQITVAETVGMEGHRGSYYDHAGAIRDVMQNHVLQLLAYAAMDAPGGLKGVNVRTEKLRVLRNLVPITQQQRRQDASCAGSIARARSKGRKCRRTATNLAWPKIRTPKRTLPCERKSICGAGPACRFSCAPASGCPSGRPKLRFVSRIGRCGTRRRWKWKWTASGRSAPEPNVLVFRIQPDEGISLSFVTKQPGMGFSLQPVQMEFDYEQAFHVGLPEAYERLLLDAIKGIPLLFMRSRRGGCAVGIYHADYRSMAKTTAAEISKLRSRDLGPGRRRSIDARRAKANGGQP